MEDAFYKNLVTLAGVMFAAIVGGFFSFVSLVSSKEQKVSEFRQEWINSLRESISQHISSLYYLSLLFEKNAEKLPENRDKFELAKGVEEVYSKVNKTYNDIIFRINENEKSKVAKEINSNFLMALEKTRDLYNKNELSKAKRNCDEIRRNAKPLLKLEWERVKSGEPTYRYSKYFAIIILLVGFLVFAYSAYKILGKATPKGPKSRNRDDNLS